MTREAIGVDVVMDRIFSPNRSKSKKTCFLLLCQMRDINSLSEGIPCLEIGTTHCHTQFGHLEKGRAIIGFVVCNS